MKLGNNDIPLLLKKEKYLQDTLVFTEHIVFDRPDTAEHGLSYLHQHQFIEISYIESGNGIHRIWNESYPVQSGDLYILNMAVPHGFFSKTNEPMVVHSLYFDPQDIFTGEITESSSDKYLYGLFSNSNFAVHLMLKSKQLRRITNDFNEIGLEAEEMQTGWQDAVRSRITLLLLTCKRLAEMTGHANIYNDRKDTRMVSDIFRLVQDYYSEPDFSLKKVSEILFRSISVISTNFYEVTGIHFSEYLCSFRIQQAALLALETDYSNEEIASACGYSNLHSFYKQFRQVLGTTPAVFRREHKIENSKSGHAFYNRISEKLQQCKREDVLDLIVQGLEEGLEPLDIMNHGLVQGMNVIAAKFHTNDIFMVEVHSAARIMNAALDVLKPYLMRNEISPLGCAIICTVKGDLHDIGKNLVKLMLQVEGFDCIDLGVDVSPSAVVDAVREHDAKLVCLSSLLTTTMMGLKDTIDALTRSGLRKHVRIMVGGAPITQEYADAIGADCYTPDAVTAAKEAHRMIDEMNRK